MRKTTKITIASFVVALAATVGMAAPADAKPVSSERMLECC